MTLLILTTWLAAAGVEAQTYNETIVVTADRTEVRKDESAAAIVVLTRRDLDRLPVRNLAEALRYAAGIDVLFASGSGSKPIVASHGYFGGGEVETVKLIVDGVPAGDAETTLVDWRGVAASEIERIEIVRGAGSPVWGDAAIGGVVQVFTRRPESRNEGEVAATLGTSSERGISASYRGPFARFGLAPALRVDDAGGWRDHSNETRRAGSLSATSEHWRVTLGGNAVERDDPGPLPLAVADRDSRLSDDLYRFDHESTTRQRAAATVVHFTGGLLFNGTFSAERRSTELLRSLLLAPGFGDSALRSVDSTAGSASGVVSAPWQLAGKAAESRAGIDVARAVLTSDYFAVTADGDRGTRQSSTDAARTTAGLFVSQDWHPLAGLRISVALRRDAIRDRGQEERSAWSPRLGVSAARGSWSAWAHVARAFRTATLDQLFDARAFPDFGGGSLTISNPALEPERSRGIEGGVSRAASSWRLDAAAYQTRVTNEIDFDPATFRYRNIGSSRHRGADVALSGTGRHLDWSFAWSWIQAESLAPGEEGRQLKNIPRHSARASVSASLPFDVRGTLAASLRRGRWLDDDNRVPLDDVLTADLGLRRDAGPVRVDLDVLNLFDARFHELGFVLPDFRGGSAPYVYPAGGRLARLVLGWNF
ncbi:MAG TPA: TonB-dependent receptor [Thermoanaerobaculia bacterium]|nr:TonB-dependent receptor [Thermoanaerobaculia bacterium]